jgi:hypothetical protein
VPEPGLGAPRPARSQTDQECFFSTISIALLTVIAAGTVWNASESHYRACIEARVVNYGPPLSSVDRGEIEIPGEKRTYTHATTAGCTRTPW